MYIRLTQAFAEREKFGHFDQPTVAEGEEKPAYHQYPIKVTRRFRDDLIAAFPALESHPRAKAYRAMLEYLLYATLKNDEGRLVFPAETLANLVGEKVGANGFRALDYMQGFSTDIFPLDVSDYVKGKLARTVAFDLPDVIAEMMVPDALFATDEDKVWLVSGLPVSPTSRRKAAARYDEEITLLCDGVGEDHPAHGLQTYLNAQPQFALAKHVRRNWHRLVEMHGAMAEGEGKNSAGFILLALEDRIKNLYGGSDKTARISTRGLTIHSLPRAMRKAALSGAVELDIRSSQAAIVARLWGLSGMDALLRSGASFWSVMLTHLDLTADAKPALKTALYATCFGMGKRKLVRNLAAEIGREKAIVFFKHPLMVEILRGRSEAMKRVRAAGGIEDAFGRFVEVSRDTPAHALLAIEAQSWELKLMLATFEEVKSVRDLSILSWLHDGVVIHHPERERLVKLIGRAKIAFDRNANALGFATELDVSYL